MEQITIIYMVVKFNIFGNKNHREERKFRSGKTTIAEALNSLDDPDFNPNWATQIVWEK